MDAAAFPSECVLSVDEFVRRLLSRGRDLHWLTGAGVSLSAGVPTATDLSYDFKRVLYAQEKRIPITQLDASDPDVRLRLDAFFVDSDGFVPPGHPEEYAVLFEAVHRDRASRQRTLESILEQAEPKPALGHLVLAGLWRLGLLHVVWTTNFDDVLEQAAIEVAGKPGWLTVADLDHPAKATGAFTQTDRPLLVKMHGDFRSERLANTRSEIQAADNQLRRNLSEAMRTRGLVVVGYSGRDATVMGALDAALDADQPFGAGLYWVARPDGLMLPAVRELIERARGAGRDAFVVPCPSFEELMQSVRLLLEVDAKLESLFNRFQPAARLSPFEQPPRGGRWPKIRLNAVAVASYPKTARRVDCRIGGTREVRAAVETADVDVIVARRRDGVIAFGDDADLMAAFAPHQPSLDYAALDPVRRDRQESADLGLLYDALARALQRDRPLLGVRRRRRRFLVVDPGHSQAPELGPLRQAVSGALAGRVPRSTTQWAEGVELRLEHRFGNLWLIYLPMVWFEGSPDRIEDYRCREWARERQAKRYNRASTALFKAWADVLCSQSREVRISALGIQNGADATFVLKRLAPFVERIAL